MLSIKSPFEDGDLLHCQISSCFALPIPPLDHAVTTCHVCTDPGWGLWTQSSPLCPISMLWLRNRPSISSWPSLVRKASVTQEKFNSFGSSSKYWTDLSYLEQNSSSLQLLWSLYTILGYFFHIIIFSMIIYHQESTYQLIGESLSKVSF